MAPQLSPYLFFATQCEDALSFYADCKLGKVVELVRYGDDGMPVRTPSFAGKIMHATFSGQGVHFNASDNDDAEPMKGSALLLEFDDLPRAQQMFKRLSKGGRIEVAFAPHPWGAHFGKLTDAFGVQWMFNCQTD